MRHIWTVLFVALAATVAPSSRAAQGSAAQSGPGVISGVVVDGVTGAVVPNATTTLAPFIPAGSMPLAQFQLLVRNGRSDAQGRFSFADVSPGDYDVSATADGYAAAGYGQTAPDARRLPLTVGAGAKLADTTIKIWKVSSIAGMVTNESGAALANARVSLWQRLDGPAGQVGYRSRPSVARTDQSGHYEIARLNPASYVVGVVFRELAYSASVEDAYHAAASTRPSDAPDILSRFDSTGLPAPSGRGVRMGEFFLEPPGSSNDGLPTPSPSNGPLVAYRSTFHPSARRVEESDVVVLRPGETRPDVNVRVPIERTFRITGVAKEPNGPAAFVALRLVLAASAIFLPETSMEVAATITDAHGAFTLLGVPAGHYVLAGIVFPPRPAGGIGDRGATPTPRPIILGTVEVTVESADVTGLSVILDSTRRRP